MRTSAKPKRLGWREWIELPDWDVPHIKAKIDTGARTSALHAFDIEEFEREDDRWVRFLIHPWQETADHEIAVEALIVENRDIRSSSGAVDTRLVVRTTMCIAGRRFEGEITLTQRDEMGFRMLIGREALRGRFIVDPARSYVGGKPSKSIRRRNRDRD